MQKAYFYILLLVFGVGLGISIVEGLSEDLGRPRCLGSLCFLMLRDVGLGFDFPSLGI